MITDLRSDTVTKPTPGMMDAIMTAETGDDIYKEDPTVNELEKRMAVLFGMEEALFFPTGSMANQAAIKLHTNPGEQLICDKWAHVYNYEGGGVSFNSGVSCKLIDGLRGMITAAQVVENINPPDFYHSALTSLVCLENTTNKGGGTCYDINEIKAIKKVCVENGLGLHLDGARLMNAIVARGHNPREFGVLADTISVCFSKGLGAPLGTVLLGNKDLMANAIRVRKVLGGGMRQVGFMAAAAIYALDHHIERLVDDHRKATEIAEVLSERLYVMKVEPTDTNIVIFYLSEMISEEKFMNDLKEKGVLISNMGQGRLRIVTHLDYTQAMHHAFLEILRMYS